MIKRFQEIKRGRLLSVGRAQYKANMSTVQFSPVYDMHSVRCVERKQWLDVVERDNMILMKKLCIPNHTVRTLELEKKWRDGVKIKEMISKSKRFNFDRSVDHQIQEINSCRSLPRLAGGSVTNSRLLPTNSQSLKEIQSSTAEVPFHEQPVLKDEVVLELLKKHANHSTIEKPIDKIDK